MKSFKDKKVERTVPCTPKYRLQRVSAVGQDRHTQTSSPPFIRVLFSALGESQRHHFIHTALCVRLTEPGGGAGAQPLGTLMARWQHVCCRIGIFGCAFVSFIFLPRVSIWPSDCKLFFQLTDGAASNSAWFSCFILLECEVRFKFLGYLF